MFPFTDEMLENIGEIFCSPVIQYHNFSPQNEYDLDLAAFELKDGRCFLASDGPLGYRAWQTDTYVRDRDLLIKEDDDGRIRLLWRSTGKPIKRYKMWGLE